MTTSVNAQPPSPSWSPSSPPLVSPQASPPSNPIPSPSPTSTSIPSETPATHTTYTPSPSIPRRDRDSNDGNELSAFSIPPLPQLELPPLPTITDQVIYDIVTSHASLRHSPRSSHELYPTKELLDYEKLEHVGDALLGAVVVLVLHDIFPFLAEGPASMLKSQLVSNNTLAQISERYRLPSRLRADAGAKRIVRGQVKTKASMLEAWVAGVFFSTVMGDAEEEEEKGEGEGEGGRMRGLEVAVAGLKLALEGDLDVETGTKPERQDGIDGAKGASGAGRPSAVVVAVSDTPSGQSIVEEEEGNAGAEPNNHPAHAQALSTRAKPLNTSSLTSAPQPSSFPPSNTQTPHPSIFFLPPHLLPYRWLAMATLDRWLRPIFTPLAHFAMAELREEQARLSALPLPPSAKQVLATHIIQEDMRAKGAMGLLNQAAQKRHMGAPMVEFESVHVEGELNPHFKAICTGYDDDGGEHTAEAIRTKKHTAQALAAYRVCLMLGLIEDDDE